MPSSVSVSTTVGGPIISDTTWTEVDSPYIVTSNVLVTGGVTLTIEPGVIIKFNADFSLRIDGALVARGTTSKMITFTSNKPSSVAGDWQSITFTDTSLDAYFNATGHYVGGCILEHVVVKYGGGGDITNGAIEVSSSSPLIRDSIITKNSKSGIYVSSGKPKIISNIIHDNTVCGVHVHGWGDYLDVWNNTIGSNSQGGVNTYGASGRISDNLITSNGGTGVRLTYGNVTVSGNVINDNLQFGVYANGGDFTITNNTIGRNLQDGVCVSSTIGTGGSIVSDNLITSNGGTGVRAAGGNVDVIGNVINKNLQWGVHGSGYTKNISKNLIFLNVAGGVTMVNVPYGKMVSNNIIADNLGRGYSGYWKIGSHLRNNAFVRNKGDYAIYFTPYTDSYTDPIIDLKHNTITGNECLNGTIYLHAWTFEPQVGFPLSNYNNIFKNSAPYDMSNDYGSWATINAENNWWGTSNETKIQAKIYDWFDDSSKGIIDYSPYSTSIRTDTPISPPTGLTVDAGGIDFTLSWNRNPEPDLAGYKIYYDTDSGHPYRYSIDVGNVNTYTLTGLPSDIKYFTVTAYDAEADGINDLFKGHESWYGQEHPQQLDLSDLPEPFVVGGILNMTFVVGGTHPHGPFNWSAWTVDVLGGMGVAARLGHDAYKEVNVFQAADDDIADYDPGTGSLTIYWDMITTDTMASIGSGAVNLVSLYYNDTIPFKFVKNSRGVYLYSELSRKYYDVDFYGYYDYAVIALIDEPNVGPVLLTYGITGKGSQAACLILQHYDLYPTLHQGKAVIVKWEDLNGNIIPDISDRFTRVETWIP